MSYLQDRPIVVVGSINMDLVSTTSKIPAAGETILGASFQMHPGGKGANQAVAAARLGYPVQMIGQLGSDIFGNQLRLHLEDAGVGTSGVGQVHGSSGTASIVVAAGGENCIVVNPAANAAVTPDYLETHLPLLRGAAMLLAQLEIPLETIEYLAAFCKRENVPLMLDPAPAHALPDRVLKSVNWFTPNETEAAFYGGNPSRNDPANTARDLHRLGLEGVILKLGSGGAYLSSGELQSQIPAPEVKVVDSTAAGDTFNGAFAVSLLRGKPLVESVRFAIAAASVSVTRAGAQPSMPTMDEVTQMMQSRQV